MLFSILASHHVRSEDQSLPPSEQELPPEMKVLTEEDRKNVDYFLLRLGDSNRDRNLKWWIDYRRANLWRTENPELACEKYAELSQDQEFPLKKVAALRALDICPAGSEQLKNISGLEEKPEEIWMQTLALEASLSRAEKDKDLKKIMELSVEKSKQNLPQKLKVDLMKKAIESAKGLKLKGKEMESLNQRLYSLSPKLNPKPKKEDRLEVALDHRRYREFDKAIKNYTLVLNDKKSSFLQKRQALNGIRLSYKNARNKPAYLKATAQWADLSRIHLNKNPKTRAARKLFHDSYTTLARTQWTLSHVTQARKTLREIESTLKGKFSLGEVYWLLGRMDEEKQEFASAVEWFKKGLEERNSTDTKEKLLWYEAWNQRKIEKMKEAAESLMALKDLTLNDFARSRYTYWLARSLEQSEQKEEAKKVYTELISADPLGYYGLLAHRELKLKIPATEIKRKTASLEVPPEAKHWDEIIESKLLEWLIAADEQDLATRYLDEVSNGYKKRKDQDPETWMALLKTYARSGSYLALFAKLGELPSARRDLILDSHPELLFPKPFYEQVKQSAEEHKVRLELIYAIMRQESAFNPRARSPADAFGLMQLLPELAKKSPLASKVSYQRPDDLFDPSVNIPMGAAHLRELDDQHKGNFILMVASYNASQKAIKGWVKTRFRGDTVEFIEDIPYEETRGYVRLVLRNMIYYSLIESNWTPFEFPEWTLELKTAKGT